MVSPTPGAATGTAVDAGGGEASATSLGAHPIQPSVSTDTDSTHSHRSSLSSDGSTDSLDAANRMTNRETNRENVPSPTSHSSSSSRRPSTIAEDTGANVAAVGGNAADARAATEAARNVDALGRLPLV
jgi:hypothetical protein